MDSPYRYCRIVTVQTSGGNAVKLLPAYPRQSRFREIGMLGNMIMACGFGSGLVSPGKTL